MISNSLKIRRIIDSLRRHETWLLCLHEKHAYQGIQMLWCNNPSLWQKAPAMRTMPKNLENPGQETGSSSRQNPSCFARAYFSATTNSRQHGSAASSHGPGFELSVSKSSPWFCPEEILSKIAPRPAHPLARWDMVLFQGSTVDSSFGRSQTHRGPSRDLLGPPASEGYRKPERMDAVHRNDPSRSQNTHPRRRLRQFSWFQKTGSSQPLGIATVSFSFDLPIPVTKRSLETPHSASEDPRVDLSTGQTSFGTSRWHTTSSCSEPVERSSASCAHNPSAHVSPRILEKHPLLSKLSDSSILGSSQHNEHHRINEPIDTGSDASLRQFTHTRRASTLGHCFYTYAA